MTDIVTIMENIDRQPIGLKDTRTPKPETFRLPKAGERDPHFGLPRTTYYELEKANAIRLIRLRKRGNLRGTTLVPFDDVSTYLRGLAGEVR
jgi:hypothetical protein